MELGELDPLVLAFSNCVKQLRIFFVEEELNDQI